MQVAGKFDNMNLATETHFLLCTYNADVLSQHFNYGNSARTADCMPAMVRGHKKQSGLYPPAWGRFKTVALRHGGVSLKKTAVFLIVRIEKR